MLKREDSNKILKHVKVILFATGLSLLNPINVEAQEITQQEVIEENTENNDIQEEAKQNSEKEKNENNRGLLIVGIATVYTPIIMICSAALLPLIETDTNSLEKKEKTEKIKRFKK